VIEHGWLYYTWLAPAAVAIGLLLVRRRARWAIGAASVFAIALLPVLGVATFQFQFHSTVADHYMYLAMLGPAVALAFVARGFRWRTIASVALVVLGARTLTLTPIWHDDFSLFGHNLQVNPNSVIAYNNLGHVYTMQNDLHRALEMFNRAMALAPEYPTPFENAGRVLAVLGDVRGSIAASERSIDIRARMPRTLYPNYMEDHNYVGQVLLALGEYDRAIAHFRALLAIKPNHADAKKYLAIALEKKRQQSATHPATTRSASRPAGWPSG
jgi:tetratricopeptide (TPR) repeat protein